ncbi:MAG: hypothetical protein VX727_05870 [Planctomycetota bacterium]|nr:hypothetical protein [Planctomycetota bacterium]
MKSITAFLASCIVASAAFAGADVGSWSVDFSTSGQPVSWMSPDSVRTDGQTYDVRFEIQSIDVLVSYFGLEFGPIDVTDQLGADGVQQGTVAGPCPIDFGSSSVREPPAPDPVTIAFDVQLQIDEQGFASYEMTNIVLGTASYNLGFPFGEVTVSLEQVSISGQFDVEVIGSSCVADIDGSGTVGVDDLLSLIGDWGPCSGCATDLNGDGTVGVDDLLELIGSWGLCG